MLKKLFSRAVENKARNDAIASAQSRMDAIDMMQKDRAVLISIAVENNKLRFGFIRNDKLFHIELYNSMSYDVSEWQKTLLERKTLNGG